MVSAELGDRRPVGADRRQLRVMSKEFCSCMDDGTVHNGEHAFQPADVVFLDGKIIIRKNCQVGQAAGRQGPFGRFLAAEPRAARGPQLQGLLPVEPVRRGVDFRAADGFAGNKPPQAGPRMVTGHPRPVRTPADRQSHLQH